MAEASEDCPHERIEFDPGNHVPGFGWEIHPGYYCFDCGAMVDDPQPENDEPDPDLLHKIRQEEGW